MDMKQKDIPGYDGEYYLDPKSMQVINKKTEKPLKSRRDGAGYAEVELWKDNKREHKSLHKLFAEAYIPNPGNLPEINHKDENPMNYSLENLEWCTHSYNQNYGTINKRRGSKISEKLKGRERPLRAGRKPKPIIAIDESDNEQEFNSINECARELNLRQSSISKVLRGERKTTGGMKFRYI